MSTTVPPNIPYLTSFTPPEYCNTPLLLCIGKCIYQNPIVLSYTCSDGGPVIASECYQDGAQIAKDLSTRAPPSIFTYRGTGCGAGQTALRTAISSGTTTIDCCPTNFYAQDSSIYCASNFSSAVLNSAYYCYGESSLLAEFSYNSFAAALGNALPEFTQTYTTYETRSTGLGSAPHYVTVITSTPVTVGTVVWAAEIKVVQDPITQTLSSAGQESRPSTPTSRPTTTTAVEPAGSNKFSSGTKIAIGVSIPIITIIAALAFFLFFRRRRRRIASMTGREGGGGTKAELEGNPGLTFGNQRFEKAELHANQEHQPWELDNGAKQDEPRIYELPADIGEECR